MCSASQRRCSCWCSRGAAAGSVAWRFGARSHVALKEPRAFNLHCESLLLPVPVLLHPETQCYATQISSQQISNGDNLTAARQMTGSRSRSRFKCEATTTYQINYRPSEARDRQRGQCRYCSAADARAVVCTMACLDQDDDCSIGYAAASTRPVSAHSQSRGALHRRCAMASCIALRHHSNHEDLNAPPKNVPSPAMSTMTMMMTMQSRQQ